MVVGVAAGPPSPPGGRARANTWSFSKVRRFFCFRSPSASSGRSGGGLFSGLPICFFVSWRAPVVQVMMDNPAPLPCVARNRRAARP